MRGLVTVAVGTSCGGSGEHKKIWIKKFLVQILINVVCFTKATGPRDVELDLPAGVREV